MPKLTPPSPTEKVTPAYTPYPSLESFLGKLKASGVTPNPIDKGLMHGMSGALQSHMMVALRFLQLIGPNGETTPELEMLVDSHGTAGFKPALGAVIERAYKPVLGDLNIKTTTARALRERFKETSDIEGATIDKALRFYIKAMKTAGLPMSAHVSARKTPTRRSAGNGRAMSASLRRENNAEDDNEVVPEGMIRVPVYVPGKPQGSIVIHDDLNEADCEMIHAMLLAIAKRRQKTK
jgi:hypothetical protein